MRNTTKITKEQTAFLFYENKEFDKAILAFKSLSNLTGNEKVIISFYMAICYLETNNLNVAKELLTEIITQKNNDWEKESLWYLSLVELKLNNTANAKKYLNQLQNFKSDYKKRETTQLLNKMNN